MKYARDSLGTIEEGQFIPNDYYLCLRPTKEKRPEERWSEKQRKEMVVSAISDEKAADDPSEAKPNFEIETKSVGVTALAASILECNGMIEDLLDMFDGDVDLVTRLINISMGAAVTAQPTYLITDESKVQLFFGNKTCPTSSPHASELHQKIGEELIVCLHQQASCRAFAKSTDPYSGCFPP